ncbi:MAG TPA: SUF system NifU family Fe-S cluster assembly protein [Candidatus Sulfotelmatobacter sp.]|jgi:nitrogen fixation NifU-like protein|nr:SUF system NifU family Fe-S cluster assembly protein [Candidatus Sulfotelmatobacter sp.]
MSDLRDLYQEVILDHSKRPRNFRRPELVTGEAHGRNPLCGDTLTVYVDVENGTIKDVAFQGHGCAISTASASMMTESLKGKTVEEGRSLFEWFHRLLTTPPGIGPPAGPLGKLAVFSGVREFPVRVKCATLAWHTLQAALDGTARATTE